MHLVLSVNVKSCKCVWPVHCSPSFGFLTVIIWKTHVTVNHDGFVTPWFLLVILKLLLFDSSRCYAVSHWAFHLLKDRGMFLFLCAAIPCGTDCVDLQDSKPMTCHFFPLNLLAQHRLEKNFFSKPFPHNLVPDKVLCSACFPVLSWVAQPMRAHVG